MSWYFSGEGKRRCRKGDTRRCSGDVVLKGELRRSAEAILNGELRRSGEDILRGKKTGSLLSTTYRSLFAEIELPGDRKAQKVEGAVRTQAWLRSLVGDVSWPLVYFFFNFSNRHGHRHFGIINYDFHWKTIKI